MPLPVPAPFETARLRIRPFLESDLPALMPLNGDERVTKFLPYATWHSAADAEAWLARSRTQTAQGQGIQFVLQHKASGTLAGTSLLFRHDEASARAELGYALAHAHWGQGLMHEALAALLDQAFGSCGLRRLEAQVNPANRGSHHLLLRLGFKQEGCMRQRYIGKSGAYDVNVYGLLAQEWPHAPP